MALALAGLVAAGVASIPGPATAASSLRLSTTASTNTTVGLQIFANLNLSGAVAPPTGNATFRLYRPGDMTCASPIFTSVVPVTSTSVNSAAFRTTQAGTYRWTTTYSGDANYLAGGPTPCDSPAADVIVSKARNILRVSALAPVGRLLRASASLSGYNPRGLITFFLYRPGDVFCLAGPIFTSTVGVFGLGPHVSGAFTATTPGTYRWRASYGGDANNQGSSITSCLNFAGAVNFSG